MNRTTCGSWGDACTFQGKREQFLHLHVSGSDLPGTRSGVCENVFMCVYLCTDPPLPLKIYKASLTLCLFTFLISISSPSPAVRCGASIDTYLPNQLCVCACSMCVLYVYAFNSAHLSLNHHTLSTCCKHMMVGACLSFPLPPLLSLFSFLSVSNRSIVTWLSRWSTRHETLLQFWMIRPFEMTCRGLPVRHFNL